MTLLILMIIKTQKHTVILIVINYNSIDDSSLYSLLRADCRPSERLNKLPQKVWVCLMKRDGKIKSAHWSCMAGMS